MNIFYYIAVACAIIVWLALGGALLCGVINGFRKWNDESTRDLATPLAWLISFVSWLGISSFVLSTL